MVTTKQQILDIAMNLNRMGNWAADGYETKQKRIKLFLDQTNGYIETINLATLPKQFAPTMRSFVLQYSSLIHEGKSKPPDIDVWAEKMMTWGNILTHRASLLS